MKHDEYKEHLLTQIVSSADVQEQRARQNAGDKRYADAVKVLKTLAQNLERVPANDPFFSRACNLRFGSGAISDLQNAELIEMSNAELQLISKYGFSGKAGGKTEPFLRAMLDTLTRTAIMKR